MRFVLGLTLGKNYRADVRVTYALPTVANGLLEGKNLASAPFGLCTLSVEALPQRAVPQTEEMSMKKLLSAIVALGLAVAFTAPTLAADVTAAKTKAACTKAGGMWDATAKACKPKS